MISQDIILLVLQVIFTLMVVTGICLKLVDKYLLPDEELRKILPPPMLRPDDSALPYSALQQALRKLSDAELDKLLADLKKLNDDQKKK